MADQIIFRYFNTQSAKLKFEDICREEIASAQNVYLGGVGTLGEKRMHRVLKRMITDDPSAHEIKIADALEADGCEKPKNAGKYVADVFSKGEIFEVQTGGFSPLTKKIKWIFDNTPYELTLIHPIAAERQLLWIDTNGGEVSEPHKGRRRGKFSDIAGELYFIRDFIIDPKYSARFRLVLTLLNVNEYRNRDGWSKDGKRGSTKYELIPTGLIDTVELRQPCDYAEIFLPEILRSGEFTAAEYAKATGIRGITTYSILHFLEDLGIVSATGEKRGRAELWTYEK